MQTSSFKMVIDDQMDMGWGGFGKHADIYRAVLALPIGRTLRVECDSKTLSTGVRTFLQKHQKGNYRLRSHKVPDKPIWGFVKEGI